MASREFMRWRSENEQANLWHAEIVGKTVEVRASNCEYRCSVWWAGAERAENNEKKQLATFAECFERIAEHFDPQAALIQFSGLV